MSKKSATPFTERPLLQQERTIEAACEFRLNKLPPESNLKVVRDLLRAAEHRFAKSVAAGIQAPQPSRPAPSEPSLDI
jgi:hypothetical protein